MADTSEEGRDGWCKVMGHDWHVETKNGQMARLRCGNRCWIDRGDLVIIKAEMINDWNSRIIRLAALLDSWNGMSKGVSPTTEQIMEAMDFTLDEEGRVSWAR